MHREDQRFKFEVTCLFNKPLSLEKNIISEDKLEYTHLYLNTNEPQNDLNLQILLSNEKLPNSYFLGM